MDNEEIRPPDEVKRERLIQYDSDEDKYPYEYEKFNENDDEIQKAISISLQEHEILQQKHIDYENKWYQEYYEMTKDRFNKFDKLLNDLLRVSKYDKSTKEIYEIVEPIVYNFCKGYISYYEFDNETHKKIFDCIESIRTDKNAILFLREILKSE